MCETGGWGCLSEGRKYVDGKSFTALHTVNIVYVCSRKEHVSQMVADICSLKELAEWLLWLANISYTAWFP